jgi:hypothetical protein
LGQLRQSNLLRQYRRSHRLSLSLQWHPLRQFDPKLQSRRYHQSRQSGL